MQRRNLDMNQTRLGHSISLFKKKKKRNRENRVQCSSPHFLCVLISGNFLLSSFCDGTTDALSLAIEKVKGGLAFHVRCDIRAKGTRKRWRSSASVVDVITAT